MDLRGAPKRVRTGHLTNQRTDVGWHSGAPCAMSALPGPEQTKTTVMPGEHRGRLYDVECRAPAVPSLRQQRP